MDEQNQNQAPQMPPQQPVEEKGVGGIIGIAIIVIILVVAGIYLFAAHPTSQVQPTPEVMGETTPTTAELGTQGTSDNVNAIDADLNNTDLNNLDQELNGIQAEIDASAQ